MKTLMNTAELDSYKRLSVEIKHLRAFCVVAQEMHVTRAAKRLRIAQPALTQQIRALERSCGFSLLRAEGRGIALTEAGVFFHAEVEAILSQLHNARLQGKEISLHSTGHLNIGVTEGASFNPVLAAMFSSLRELSPNLNLIFAQKQTPDLASDIRTGKIDVAFMCPLPDPHGLFLQRLYVEDMLLALPVSHHLARQRSLAIRDLKDQALLLISHGNTDHSLESSLRAACSKCGFSPRILQTVPEFMLALNLAAAGIGLTFVPPYMRGIHAQRICYIPLSGKANITMETVVAYRADTVSSHVMDVLRVARETFRRTPGSDTDSRTRRKLPNS